MVQTRRNNKATSPPYIYTSQENIWMPCQMPVQNEIVPKVDLCLNDNDLLQVNEIAKQKINLNMSVYQIVL